MRGSRSYCLPDRSGNLGELDRAADSHPPGLPVLVPPEGFFQRFKHPDLLSTAVALRFSLSTLYNITYLIGFSSVKSKFFSKKTAAGIVPAAVSMADGSAMLLIHNPVIMEMIGHIEVCV